MMLVPITVPCGCGSTGFLQRRVPAPVMTAIISLSVLIAIKGAASTGTFTYRIQAATISPVITGRISGKYTLSRPWTILIHASDAMITADSVPNVIANSTVMISGCCLTAGASQTEKSVQEGRSIPYSRRGNARHVIPTAYCQNISGLHLMPGKQEKTSRPVKHAIRKATSA